jgi:SAM-dependent methyltransferase
MIYRLNGFDIHQCPSCLAASVSKPPDDATLAEFYNGFSFETNKENLERILTPAIQRWFRSFTLPANARMLDIGGGAGFFAKAFQEFGFGTSSFIDLDPTACRFAKEELGIEDVICDDIKNIVGHYSSSYDFIYCRHVIEHLINPTYMIEAAIRLLKPGGILILQFPNGLSLEYFAFPERLKPFAKKIKDSNGFSKLKVLFTLLSTKNAFGLDPIRHLWAIPPKSIARYLENRAELSARTYSASVTDPVYSPYFTAHNQLQKTKAMIARHLISPIRGGAHGIVDIRKSFTVPR